MPDGFIQKKFYDLRVTVSRDTFAACGEDGLRAFCQSLFAEPTAGQLIKRGAYKTVYRSALGGIGCVIKTYAAAGLTGLLKTAAVPSRGRQEFAAASYIHRQGIATARPLLLAEKKTLGLVRESAVVLEFIEGAQELRDFLFYDRAARSSERWGIIERFGSIAALIFQKGVYQYDLALQNFLIRREPDASFGLYFIDFERVLLKGTIARKAKIDVLARLARVGAEISFKDRLRFLRGYLGQDPGIARNLRDFAAEMIGASVAATGRDRRRGRLTSIYTHARYERLRQGDRTGLYRTGTDLPVLLSAVAAISGRQAVGQLVIRHAGKSLTVRAVYLEPVEAEDAWAALTALKISGMPLDLPHGLVCSEITGCLLLDPLLPAKCERFFAGGGRSRDFVLRHFPDEVELLKSLLAKM